MNQHVLNLAVVGLLFIFIIYRRIRRNIGFQRFSRRRLITRMTLLGVVSLFILTAAVAYPVHLIAIFVGALLGLGLAYLAMRTTEFQDRDGVHYYKPNPWVGLVLLVVFLLRIVERVVSTASITTPGTGATQLSSQNVMQAYTQDPWTSGAFFLLCAYYIVYYVFLLRKDSRIFHK